MASLSYHPRLLDHVLEQRLRHHPAILITGPRATGKTTTAARFAGSVIRLDDPAQASVVEADPDSALRGLVEPVLIDEWQVVPQVLAAVKRTVDAEPRPGRFLVTGSVRGDLDSPTWPGTGRLLRIAMFGMTVGELNESLPAAPVLDRLPTEGVEVLLDAPTDQTDLRGYAELAASGGFPQPALGLPASERSAWYESYIDQLISRDLSDSASRRDPLMVRRYLESYALNTAGVVDHTDIQEAAGVSKATGEAYERLLMNLLVVDAIPAWWSNRLKRLARRSKRYLVDPGLVVGALRLDVAALMRDGNLLGRIIDTFAVAQLRAQIPACASQPRLYHLRTDKGQHEVDCVVEYGGGRMVALEFKASSAPKLDDSRHLQWLRAELGDRFIGGAVIHTGPRAFMLSDQIVAAPISTLW